MAPSIDGPVYKGPGLEGQTPNPPVPVWSFKPQISRPGTKFEIFEFRKFQKMTFDFRKSTPNLAAKNFKFFFENFRKFEQQLALSKDSVLDTTSQVGLPKFGPFWAHPTDFRILTTQSLSDPRPAREQFFWKFFRKILKIFLKNFHVSPCRRGMICPLPHQKSVKLTPKINI